MRAAFPRVAAATLLLFAGTTLAATPAKKLIEFGWDEPDPRFMRAHITEMQASPFDGCVFHANYRAAAGDSGNFTWSLWGRRRFSASDLDSARIDLMATPFGRFRENFLRVNVTPGRLDWFEDHSAVMANLELAARLAKQGGCPGILFDVEQYEGALWDFKAQTREHPRSWTVMSAQVRKRGAQAMRAFQRGFPGLTVFMTWAYSLPLDETVAGRVALPDTHNGLLVPFLEGMFAAASDRTIIVDGHEGSYPYREPGQFSAKADSVRHNVLRLTAQPEKYRRHLSVGFGIWLDYDWRHRGWDSADPSQNYFTPATLARSVRAALQHSDRYVWIYSETPRWWTGAGTRHALPAAYDSVLRTVRQ